VNPPADQRADAFLDLIERSKRGRLKVYLGYGPGVGKTYRMLQEAQALRAEGVDVVVGYVENHGRAETQALVDGLEVVPRRSETYRGLPLKEMDVDAVLARRPAVALVDELAHTNAPGSRHGKRYEDVGALLDAGIHVLSTLNVQHLESLYGTVERVTGVKVKERVPDWVLAEADQVVNVDLSAEDLRARLAAGKVYPEERARAALASFFTPDNLEHLRNLTLRQTARAIEAHQPAERRMAAPDQVVVCLSSRGPDSAALLRTGARLAGAMNRTWYALHVQTSRDAPDQVDAATQRVLSDTLALATTLGATVFTYKGDDVAQTVLRFAREYGAAQIVIGKGRPLPAWRRALGERTVLERLIDRTRGETVVVVDTQSTPEPVSPLPAANAASAPAAQALGAPRPRLTDWLARDGVVVWEGPVTKEEAIRVLAARAADRAGLDPDDAAQRVWARERDGSTFVGSGVAFPHARIEGLEQPALALGAPRGGLVGAPADEEVEAIWLLLLPHVTPGFLPTAAVARASRSDALREALRRGSADAIGQRLREVADVE
jgi:two-component system sensor histidine kinase KdpD